MWPSCGPPDWDARRSRERGVTRLPGLDLGLTSKVQADRGDRAMLTIGKLAAAAGVRSDTLRYYEREGLIEPAGKSPAGYRLYDQESARRLRFIRQAQHCGFTLAEIRGLLVLRGRDAARCGDVRQRAIEKKRQLEGTGIAACSVHTARCRARPFKRGNAEAEQKAASAGWRMTRRGVHKETRRNRREFPTTLTEESAMAAAAMIGESRMPKIG